MDRAITAASVIPTGDEAVSDHGNPESRLRPTIMSRSIIVCDRLSKRYHLGVHRGKGAMSGMPSSLRETISGKLRDTRDLLTRTRREKKPADNVFWALKDVSFEVDRGEVVGIVGRNGAGKSTLLKILSRIVEPTGGTARLRGRVASLLEVGTGFHPELSGRENIYLNGAILGMRKAEIDRKFDEIVAFSEIEEFLDTPVKRYSSGMYVRLAFAVAAHLEPEILIVDEVLAVGDYAFQKKCLGKMQDVATGDGRTILFVSHNMGALTQLCGRGILLEHGDGLHGRLHPGRHRALSPIGVRPPDGPGRVSRRPIQALPVRLGRDPPRRWRPGDGLQLRRAVHDTPPVRGPAGRPRPEDVVHPAQPGRHPRLLLRCARRRPIDHRAAGDRPAHLRDHDARPAPGAHDLSDEYRLLRPGPASSSTSRESCCEFTLRDLVSQRPDRPGFLSVMLRWEHHKSHRSNVVVGAETAREAGDAPGRGSAYFQEHQWTV